MGSPEIMAAWDEMRLKCAEYDAMVEQRDEARRINTERTAIWKAQERVMARMCEERDAALALAERRAGECDTLRAMLTRREVQWANGSDHDGLCPICDAWEHDGHAEGCALAALAAAPPSTATNEDVLQRLITVATRLCDVSWGNDGRLWEMRCELRDVLESLAPASPPATAAAGEDAGGMR
jgi:hypothetical protein